MSAHHTLRDLPSVERVLASPPIAALIGEHGRAIVVDQARLVLAEERAARLAGRPPAGFDELVTGIERAIRLVERRNLRQVINGAGVIIHTNLGRALLSAEAAAAASEVATSYSNLEYDLEEGERGSRHVHLKRLLTELTGAEDGLVVNNNAGAVLLALAALATGQEIVVSRSQAIEIGGGFRIPEVMQQSGGRLVEVGTTNRTYPADYERAITPETAILLRVHHSNFRIIGFTHETSLEELVELAGRRGLRLVDDLGSGCLVDPTQFGLGEEPIVQDSVKAGADLVCFSGDKLLGGPQAGLIVGKADAVRLCARHPLARALRIDKMSLAAMEVTLRHYRRGEAIQKIPVWRMIAASPAELESRGRQWISHLSDIPLTVNLVASQATVGGGSLPGEALSSWAVAIEPATAAGSPALGDCEAIARALRSADRPVISRIERDRVLIDLRTILPEDDEPAIAGVRRALAG